MVLSPTGQRDEQNPAEAGGRANAAGHLVAVHVRHPDVEQDGVRLEGVERIQRGAAAVDHRTTAPSMVSSCPSVSAASRLSSTTRMRRRGNCFGRRRRLLAHALVDDGKLDDELAALPEPVAPRLDTAAVHGDQAPHEGQADAQAALGAAARPIDLREHVEDGGQLVGGDTDAVVAHRQDRAVVLPAHAHVNAPAGVGVLGRVGQQVGEHLRQPDGVAVDDHGFGGQFDAQVMVAGIERWPARIDRGLDDHAQDRAAPDRSRSSPA